jgi:hypothetical protein
VKGSMVPAIEFVVERLGKYSQGFLQLSRWKGWIESN